MTTVFAILLIVINLGKGLIVLVNKYAARRDYCQKTSDTTKTDGYIHTGCRHHDQTTAAIVSAVSVMTGGKGKVVKIEKL